MNGPDPEAEDVKVSVAMVTYNHEPFIAQAIESVLMQQTEFGVELIIGEDCSTDGTREIVAQYARRHPERIRPLLHEQNAGAQANLIAVLNACGGRYIAALEGDDYWTDPHKLQKQVDLLEAHPDHAVCFHRAYRLDQATGEIKIDETSPPQSKPSYGLNDIVRGQFIHTASIMLRNGLVSELPQWFYEAPVGDWPLLVLYAQYGKIGFIDQAMSVHRVHGGGLWSGADVSARQRMVDEMFAIFQEHLGPVYEKQLKASVSSHYLEKSRISADLGDRPNARIYLRKSIQTSFSLRGRWIDQGVMLVRLYCPRVHRVVRWILKEGRFSPIRMLQGASTSRFYSALRTAFCKSGSK